MQMVTIILRNLILTDAQHSTYRASEIDMAKRKLHDYGLIRYVLHITLLLMGLLKEQRNNGRLIPTKQNASTCIVVVAVGVGDYARLHTFRPLTQTPSVFLSSPL